MMRALSKLPFTRLLYQINTAKSPSIPNKPTGPPTKTQQKSPSLTALENDLKAIDEVNKYFLGIRMNTSYAKFNNQDSFANIAGFTGRKISDLPFRLDSKDIQPFLYRRTGKICTAILDKLQRKVLIDHLTQMSTDYFSNLFERKRTVKIEPNFEREAHRVIESLTKSGYTFTLTKKQSCTVQILMAELYKGLEVVRNNNYAIDSYQILNNEFYTFYKLWEKGSYKIPEEEWESQRNLLMRITVNVTAPYNIKIEKKNEDIKYKKQKHLFVFEMDLKKPPRFSSFRLSQSQYISKYEPVLQNLTITNVDNRNPFFTFGFQQSQKKSLINKLV